MQRTYIRTSAVVIAAVISLASVAPAQAAPADLKAKADAYLKSAYPAAGPGAAVIIMDDGKIVYAAGQGLADIEARKPITPQTVFRLGSITKQFSAAVLLQLVDEGKVSLDDKLSKYLPTFPKPGADATIRQLLNHTVGVQSYTGIPGWMVEENTNRPYTTEQMIALFKDLPAPSKPGEKFAYNNSGYVLVGAVIEKVTGKPWHQAVEERLTRPLKLGTIRYGVGESGFPNMAKGYTDGEQGPKLASKIHMSVPHAAGALVGSVEDLAKWGYALHRGKVVSAGSYSSMIAPTKLPDGTTLPYGFGLSEGEVRGRKAVGHGGGIFGFSTDSIYIPEEDVYVAVFTNSDDPQTGAGTAMRRLAALAIGDPYPDFKKEAVDVASLEPLFGVYTFKEGERRFYARDGQLFTQRTGGPESKVFYAGGDRYFYGPESLNWFQIRRDPAGAHVMEMHQNGANQPERSVRSGPIPPEAPTAAVPRATLETYAGSYSVGPATAVVALQGEGLTVKLGGQEARGLRPISATQFRVEGVDARVTFVAENGGVTRMVINHGGREMSAERVKTGS
ncbi:MAG TPA: serine hydrolase domain-containing protein [Allosphingosinicella sp.]|nr:serine hydrolase domain-containing protein [Allosphingosinicella sp.]